MKPREHHRRLRDAKEAFVGAAYLCDKLSSTAQEAALLKALIGVVHLTATDPTLAGRLETALQARARR